MAHTNRFTRVSAFTLALTLPAVVGCTGQVPGSFRLAQLVENFASSDAINTKLDVLFVVDNSASMDPSQKSLRNGFAAFASKYMKPSWDIQVGVITTDTYLANPRYTNYRNTYNSSRIKWTNTWGQLLPGNHDGPMPANCVTGDSYFYYGYSHCNVRDSQTGGGVTGINDCVNPSVSQDSRELCVNTKKNDNVHSLNPMVKTILPTGQNVATWTDKLVRDFITNVSTGSTGSGIERGLGSILQFIADNELDAQGTAPNPLFRKDSLRAIVIISDEDDQTIDLSSGSSQLDPSAGYSWDVSDVGDGGTGHCRKRTVPCLSGSCAVVPDPANANNFIANPDATHTTYTYTVSMCTAQFAGPSYGDSGLMPVGTIKSRIDTFFTDLDGTTGLPGAKANYFVASVIPLDGEGLYALHQMRGAEDVTVLGAGHRRISSDYGQRYVDFDAAVGNGSFEMSLIDPAQPDATDFTPILDKLGQVIVSKKSTFELTRAPTGSEDMIVSIVHADRTSTIVAASQYTVSGKTLTITDPAVVLAFSATDTLSVNYQPKSVF